MIKIFGLNINKDKFITLLLIVIVVLLGLIICLVKKSYKSVRIEPFQSENADVRENVKVYFEPREVQLRGNTRVRIMADSGSKNIAFSRIVLSFNPGNVQIANEIEINPAFSKVVEKTTPAIANETGKVTLVVAAGPNDSQPSGVFEFASLDFVTTPGAVDDSTVVSMITSDMQVVDSNATPVRIIPSDGILMLDKRL